MVSWGHQNVLNMILPVIFIIKSITLSCLIRIGQWAYELLKIFEGLTTDFPLRLGLNLCL